MNWREAADLLYMVCIAITASMIVMTIAIAPTATLKTMTLLLLGWKGTTVAVWLLWMAEHNAKKK